MPTTDGKPTPPSRLKPFLAQKCPRCYQGDVFIGSTYSLKFNKMLDNCPVCDLKYEIEPGFFWGSMYISYAISVAIFIGIIIFGYLVLDNPEPWVYVGLLLAILLLLTPLLFRYSRLTMLYLFGSIKYDPIAHERRKSI